MIPTSLLSFIALLAGVLCVACVFIHDPVVIMFSFKGGMIWLACSLIFFGILYLHYTGQDVEVTVRQMNVRISLLFHFTVIALWAAITLFFGRHSWTMRQSS